MSAKKQTWANAHSQLWTSSVARSAGSRTQSEISSIASPHRDRSLLDDANRGDPMPNAVSPQDSMQQAHQPRDKYLVQVSDILESYGTISCDSDIPAVLLEVVKDLERAKRDSNFKDLLLREYSDAVQRRFSLYGEESPPTIAEVSARLRDNAPTCLSASPSPAWLEEPLNELRRAVRSSVEACYEKSVELPSPVLLPDAQQTKANVAQLLRASGDELSRLADDYTRAKTAVTKKLESTLAGTISIRQLSLTAALAELEAQHELTKEATEVADSPTAGGSSTIRAALQSIIDAVPASLQIHFDLQVPEAPMLTRCGNLTELVRFLLSEYLSMERYMEGVEAEQRRLEEVFHTHTSDNDQAVISDTNVQLDDALARSLRTLQETVTAVVALPHRTSVEEVTMRRASVQAVEELAQLLVESRRSGSGSGSVAARVEPPTRELLTMVEMVKARFAMVAAQQQRKELAGAQTRVGQAHMEESMTKYGKHVVQLLRDMCAAQEADAAGEIGAAELQLMSEVMGTVDLSGTLTPAKLDHFLSDTVDRLRVVKTKYSRALQAVAASKARAEAAAQKCTGLQRRLQKAAVIVEQVGRSGLGITFPASAAAASDPGEMEATRGDGVSALRRLNLRPNTESAAGVKPSAAATTKEVTTPAMAAVTEHNIVEALQLVAARVGASGEARDWAAAQEELEQLRAGAVTWKTDTTAFHAAMATLMQRLARNGQMVKQTLFLLGTDETATDELVEEVLHRGDEAGLDSPTTESAEYVERTLAELVQKYSRWAQRLQQTTEDHLHTQRKIVKYVAAVRRFVTPLQTRAAAAAVPEDIPDDNLYDIDSCLMRAADVILPAIDAAIHSTTQNLPPPSPADDAAPDASAAALPVSTTAALTDAVASGTPSQQQTLLQLARDSAAVATGGALPYDHRIARLYETVARLYTTVTSLLQVHYLCIPCSSRRRGAGDTELIFDGDAKEDGFVDIDLDRLIRVSQQQQRKSTANASTARGDSGDRERFSREGGRASESAASPPTTTTAANNDVILRVTYQNMEVLQDTLKRFSANHKMAAIVLQKDMDAVQQLLVGMLEVYSAVAETEAVMVPNSEALHELHATLRDRGLRQKGCYFFNRVGGEGSCAWVAALEALLDGVGQMAGRLEQRAATVAEQRRLVDDVADMCAMYVTWAEHRALPASHAVTPDLLELCVRDGAVGKGKSAAVAVAVAEDGGGEPTAATAPAGALLATGAAAVTRPPKPSRTPPLTPRASNKEQQERHQQQHRSGAAEAAVDADAKVAGFTNDGAVLKVVTHMFRLAQLAVEAPHIRGAAAAAAVATDVTASPSPQTESNTLQLEDDVRNLREAVAAAERHVGELTEAKQVVELERDRAYSEAAVARAELRRWKRQHQQQHEKRSDVAPPPPSQQETVPARTSGRMTTPAAGDGVSVGMDQATAREVMEYMRVLSEELQAAKDRAGGSSGTHDLVRSPHRAAAGDESDAEGGADELADAAAAYPPRHRRRSYAEAAEQLRHQYSSTSIAPMVVIDPQTHTYSSGAHRCGSRTRGGGAVTTHPHHRYSPVKYSGPAYDVCDRQCARGLATAAQGWRHSGVNASHRPAPALAASASTHSPQQHPSQWRTHDTTPHRRHTPPSPSHDEPPLLSAAAAAAAAAYRHSQRAVPVAMTTPSCRTSSHTSTSAAANSPQRRRHPHNSHGAANAVASGAVVEETGEPRSVAAADVRAAPAGRQWLASAWESAPTPRRRPSVTGRALAHLASSATASPATIALAQQHRRPVSRDGRAVRVEDVADTFSTAVRQIDAAAQRPARTPTRRGSQSGGGQDAAAEAPPLASAEEKMSRNLNLRAAALRRLAEVVSQTAVPSHRPTRA
ncbi:hypothetical protein NESM_000740300 [Novymonas esmeraldas]|uniref:Uncharacterized protein n=1 Tax=Novymonas esmeraldas TaxID=1808958 RepID=A0AAW0EUC1_9TRYP